MRKHLLIGTALALVANTGVDYGGMTITIDDGLDPSIGGGTGGNAASGDSAGSGIDNSGVTIDDAQHSADTDQVGRGPSGDGIYASRELLGSAGDPGSGGVAGAMAL